MKNYIEENKKAYDEVASTYSEKDIFAGTNPLFYSPWFDMIIPNYDLNKKNKSLELGAGTGQVSAYLSGFGFETTCVEFSDEMVKYLKMNSPKSVIINKNILELDLSEKSYDLILAMAFIHCFNKSDLSIILNKVKTWLKDDGYFAICTTVHLSSDEGYFEKQDYNNVVRYRRKWNKEELEDFLNKHGFTIADTFYHSELTKPKAWVSYLLKKESVV